MIKQSPYGHPMIASVVSTLAMLKSSDVTQHMPYERMALADGRVFYYHPTSVLAGDDIFVVVPDASQAGRYLLAPGAVDVKLAISFVTADAAVLATLPTNSALLVHRGYWENTVAYTGGTASAIGLSSSQSPHNVKGDLHGGAGGDIAATLIAGSYVEGTAGADIAAGVVLRDGSTLRFDRITSVFTTGAGFAHLVGVMLANPGV